MKSIHHESRRRTNRDEWRKTKTTGSGKNPGDVEDECWIPVQEF